MPFPEEVWLVGTAVCPPASTEGYISSVPSSLDSGSSEPESSSSSRYSLTSTPAAGRGPLAQLLEAAVMLDVVALVLEELDYGVLGQVQLGRQGVDGLLVRVQPHVLDEALQDGQCLQRDLDPRTDRGMGIRTGQAVKSEQLTVQYS